MAVAVAISFDAGILLFRGARRRDEMVMRSALGASRWRLLRAHLIEVSLISLAGAAVGLALTFWLARLLEGLVFGAAPAVAAGGPGRTRRWP